MHESKTNLKVRYVETDQMGVVHHSNYFAWFELARSDYIIAAGITYRQMEERGIMIPVLETHCKYINGAHYDDEMIIYTKVQEISGAKVIFNYTVVREEDAKVIVRATTKHAFVNPDFKIINLRKTHPDIWEKLSSLCG
jgi:acyl-CoA thioester hydrolase